MDREFKVGDVVRLKSDVDRICLMTVSQVGANFCYCFRVSQYGITTIGDLQDNPMPFPFETLMFA